MHNKRPAIRKRGARAGSVRDLLSRLPPELTVDILDRLSGAELTPVPNVCRAWRSFFEPGSRCAPSFRAAIRARFGACVALARSGQVYLSLRRETCHLCPAKHVLPFVYVSSNALAITRVLNDPATLFPVCKACARLELDKSEFDVVVEEEHVALVSPGVSQAHLRDAAKHILKCKGFLYSDTSRFRGTSAPVECIRVSSLRSCLQSPILE